MTIYPTSLDTDLQLPVVDDNITEMGGICINALRDAVLAIEYTLGINPQGVCGDLTTRLAVSLNDDGTIKTSALSGLGLVTLPITAGMFSNYTIPEIKLVLDYSTASLFAAITSLTSSVASAVADFATLNSEFNEHVFGVAGADGYINRHVASHIDINDGANNGYQPRYTGIDLRDISYLNTGLYGDDGYVRNAKTVMDALIQINSDLVLHMLSASGSHPATFITLDTSLYNTIPRTITTVQEAFDYLDSIQTIVLEEHRASMHSTGIPRVHNVELLNQDGYNYNFGPFGCSTVSTLYNQNYVVFNVPSNNSLEWAFRQINAGDFIRINYGGFEAKYPIERVLHDPTSVYYVYIDGYHILETATATAILEKNNAEENHYGILAVAPANHNYYLNTQYAGKDTTLDYVPGSVIVVTPNCPMVTGIDLCLDQLDELHYKLYIAFYPNGNPASYAMSPPTTIVPIDVTGNLGVTPGAYTLCGVINTINRAFRSGGYNFRMVAFEYKGQLGLAIPDTIDNPGFSIVSGATGSSVGVFTENVVDLLVPTQDAFGFGALKAAVASPVYTASNTTPTKVFVGRQSKKYNLNGQLIDFLAPGSQTTDYYYDAFFVEADNFSGTERERGKYIVNKELTETEVYPGSTITVHPPSGTSYSPQKNFYGRFIVEAIDVRCDGYTEIWVVDDRSWDGNPVSSVLIHPVRSNPATWIPVRLYFSDDAVSFPRPNDASYFPFNRSSKDYFEIYVTHDGHTFGHRRASLPIQSAGGSPARLDTTIGLDYSYMANPDVINFGWHIVNVSPKLRGFLVNGSTDNNRYVRLVVSDYSTTYDTYTAYICQPDTISPLVINVGQTVTAKVGEVARLYDNTGVDYIEVMFDDDPINPLALGAGGTTFICDIRIFETMRTTEEYLCLASCEFVSNSDQLHVWNVRDLRQFGTVSEKVLSTSAISFIESGDRWIHSNGVLNGFDLVSIGTSSFEIKGGTALINGTIVNVNNFHTFPINMWYTGSDPSIVSYIVCLKQDGTTEVLPLNSSTTSLRLFDFPSIANVTLREYTLADIVNERKDLVPLYIFYITGGSGGMIMPTTLFDVRKYVTNNEMSSYLTLYNSSTISATTMPVGNFSTWQAVSNYVKFTNAFQNTILVKGTTNITTAIDFGSVPVTILGDSGNVVNCYVDGISIALSSYMKISGVNFVRYFGSDGGTPSSFVSSKATLGFLRTSTSLTGITTDIIIENCRFSTNASWRRAGAAHILFEKLGDGAYKFVNIVIRNNYFAETKAQLDVAFVNTGGMDYSTNPMATASGVLLNDVTIEGNKGNSGSWMIFGSNNYYGGSGSNSRGLSAYGLRIMNNHIDYIWHNLSRWVFDTYNGSSFTKTLITTPAMYHDVIIENNICIGITNTAVDGTFLGYNGLLHAGLTLRLCYVASPSMLIANNRMTMLIASCNGDLDITNPANTVAKSPGHLDIHHNIITPSIYNPTYFLPHDAPLALLNAIDAGIITFGNLAYANNKENIVSINHNMITNDLYDYGPSSSYYNYNFPILSTVPCNINNNTISNCIVPTSGYGIKLKHALTPIGGSGANSYMTFVHHNIITRKSTSINAYIYVENAATVNRVIINDNVFDNYTIDGSSPNVIKTLSSAYNYKITAQRNINQQFDADLFQYVNCCEVRNTDFGWRKSFYYDSVTQETWAAIALDVAALAAPDDLSDPIYINIPIIEGAMPVSFSFRMMCSNENPDPDTSYRVCVYSQISNGLPRAIYGYDSTITNKWPNPSMYTVTPATALRNDTFRTHVVTLGNSLLAQYPVLMSSQFSQTMILAICNSTYGPLRVDDAPDETAYLIDFNVTYRYI